MESGTTGPSAEHVLTVAAKDYVSPHMVRLTFSADSYFSGWEPLPGKWSRLWFPDPVDPAREHQRGYTVVDADPEAHRVAFDFLIHEPAGPASQWANRAQIGDRIVGLTPGAHSFVPLPRATRVLLVGDAAAVPAFNEILTAHEDIRIDLVLIAHSSFDKSIPIQGQPEVLWVDHEALPRVLEEICGEDSDLQLWCALERGVAATLRRRSKRWASRAKDNTLIQGYWAAGLPMGIQRP